MGFNSGFKGLNASDDRTSGITGLKGKIYNFTEQFETESTLDLNNAIGTTALPSARCR